MQAQVRFAISDVVVCICQCQYDPICAEFQSAGSTWPSSLSQPGNSVSFFELYFRTGQRYPHSFPFISLVSSKPKQIRIKKILNTKMKKN